MGSRNMRKKSAVSSFAKTKDEYIVINPPDDKLNERTVDFHNLPRVSFAIPTLNNEDTLDECLRSIVNQEYPDIEIIIVDGYSKDRTIEIAKKYTNKIYYDNGTLGSARQTSIEKSSGEILALFDSDIYIPHRKWLINAVKYFNYSNKVSTVWPFQLAPPKSSLTTRLYLNLYKLLIEDRIKNKKGVYGGGNSLFIRKYLEEIGGVNKSLHWGEDLDWAKKLKNIGCMVVYIHDPLYHDTMQTLYKFTKKQFTGAKTFTVTGYGLMNLSFWDVFYEQVVIGIKGMIKGILFDHDISWFLFPLFILIRGIAYFHTYVDRIIKTHFW
jgi:glycosyltransferase involved in cell wall biosynthesis